MHIVNTFLDWERIADKHAAKVLDLTYENMKLEKVIYELEKSLSIERATATMYKNAYIILDKEYIKLKPRYERTKDLLRKSEDKVKRLSEEIFNLKKTLDTAVVMLLEPLKTKQDKAFKEFITTGILKKISTDV
jgi:hypothetical protein